MDEDPALLVGHVMGAVQPRQQGHPGIVEGFWSGDGERVCGKEQCQCA